MAIFALLGCLVLTTTLRSALADDYRLPTIYKPSHYEVHIKLSNDTFTASSNDFTGTVVIYFTVTAATTEIKLHSSKRYIAVDSVELNNQVIPKADYTVNPTTDILTINVTTGLAVGTPYALRITYLAQLSVTDMYGFYKSSYEDATGATRYLATTQFQPTHARRAFPCFDEPAFKATFQIIITHPSSLTALSNSLDRFQVQENDSVTVQFDVTPVMSTYLVAFVVSDFTCTTGQNIGPTPYQVCSREASAATREWAVEIGPKVLEKLNGYTGLNYSTAMTKMDQVAIPDFSAGAMENWGLVTYRETALLYDPNESSNSYKQSIAAIIAHEFVHMWFGNLVTCAWWSVTFLNEGFAQFFQYYATHEVLPAWELKKQFVVAMQQPVLEIDSYLNSQALQSDASTPTEVSNKFGQITYRKGASVFRMVENIMGSENFRAGLREYLNTYQYQNTMPENLWNILSAHIVDDVSNLPRGLSEVMNNWVKTSGHPLVTVSLSGSNVILTQERFLLSGEDTESKWFIPISYTISTDELPFNSTNPTAWLTPSADLTISLPTKAWIIINNEQAGFFRVNYDNELWTRIATALSAEGSSGIPDLNKAQIVDDLFNLAKANKVLYSKIFKIIEFLKKDTSYFSWYPTFNGFNYLLRRFGLTSDLGQAISEHILDLMDNLYKSVPIGTLNETDQIYTLKQASALSWACRLGKEECVTSVRTIFNNFKENSVKPNKNLRSIVHCNGLRYSTDSSDWEFLWNTYKTSDVATDRADILSALGCTTNETLLNNYLLMSVTPNSGIRSQDGSSVFSSVYGGSDVGINVAFEFLMNSHEVIDNAYQSMGALNNLMAGIAERFTTQDQVNRLQQFIQTGGLSESFTAAATQALASAKANIAWVDLFKDHLNDHYGLNDDDVDETESDKPYYRLPKIIRPSHYDVNLNVPESAFTAASSDFSGKVAIQIKTTRSTNVIKLHAGNDHITIRSISLNDDVVPTGNFSVNTTTDILTITLGDSISVGVEYTLKIEFDGKLSTTDPEGLYKSTYVTETGVTTHLLITHFQPVHARKTFPCFDEPAFKASFRIAITHPSSLNAKSNSPILTATNLPNNLTTTQFDTTTVMSTYLVAFVISDFTCTSGESIDNVPYQVCSRDDEEDRRAWAVETGPKVLASLNKFTDFNYNLSMSKLDQFAIPNDVHGGMENWGLVIYMEESLLYDELQDSNSARETTISLIAHEFAHMWFGNLVTYEWWSEAFLSEGLASYFEWFTIHDILPDWQLDRQFVVRVHQTILETDSYLTSQALQSPASTPAEIAGKFDEITYKKGGAIFRMVEHFMGSENFKTGLQNYLKTHQYGNTKPEDLWNSLEESINTTLTHLPTNLNTVMDNWVKQAGYPLLEVNLVRNNLLITQERFLITGKDETSKWYVPVSLTSSLDTDKFSTTAPESWLTPSVSLRMTYPAGAQWIIINNQETGFFRVNYNSVLWDRIITALGGPNFSDIHELNRAQIVDDAFNLAKIDKLTYSRVFEIIKFLENDTSYYPWYPVTTEFNNLFSKVGHNSVLGEAMKGHVLQLIGNLYDSVPLTTLNEDDQFYTMKQIMAVTLACRLGLEKCVTGVKELFVKYRDNSVSPPKNLKSIVYCNGLRFDNNVSDWEFLWNVYVNTNNALERLDLIEALGCTTNQSLLNSFLEKSIDKESGIKRENAGSVFWAVYDNPVGVNVALRFMINKYDAIYELFQNWNTVGNIIKEIAARFTNKQQLDELQQFISSGNMNSQLQEAAAEAVKSAQSNLDWIETYKDDLYRYYGLDEETTPNPGSTASTTPPPGPSTEPTKPGQTTTPGSAPSIAASFSLLLAIAVVLFNQYNYN